MATYKLPFRFMQDHWSRCDLLPEECHCVGKCGNKYYLAELTPEAYDDVLGDARFYADTSYIMSEMGSAYLGVSRSAQATVRALERQGRP